MWDLKFSLNLVYQMVFFARNDHAASQKIAMPFNDTMIQSIWH